MIGSSSLVEQFRHGGIASCQFLNGQCFSFVVGQAQVVLAANERILDFLQVRNGLVNLLDGGLELLAGKAIVPAEFPNKKILFVSIL